MDARRFIREHKNDIADVAARAGTKPVYLRLIGLGHKRPSPKLAIALETASDCRMTRAELRPDLWSDGPA